MLIRCVGDCRGLVILRASFAPRAVARICGAVRLVWPKTGFRSSRMPAMRKRRVIRRMAVQEADMAELLGTSSVCRAGCFAASGLRHRRDVTVVMVRKEGQRQTQRTLRFR